MAAIAEHIFQIKKTSAGNLYLKRINEYSLLVALEIKYRVDYMGMKMSEKIPGGMWWQCEVWGSRNWYISYRANFTRSWETAIKNGQLAAILNFMHELSFCEKLDFVSYFWFRYSALFLSNANSKYPLNSHLSSVRSQKLFRSFLFSWKALTSISLLMAVVIKGLMIWGSK